MRANLREPGRWTACQVIWRSQRPAGLIRVREVARVTRDFLRAVANDSSYWLRFQKSNRQEKVELGKQKSCRHQHGTAPSQPLLGSINESEGGVRISW